MLMSRVKRADMEFLHVLYWEYECKRVKPEMFNFPSVKKTNCLPSCDFDTKVMNNSINLITKCQWLNNGHSSQMGSLALSWKTGGRWRSWSRRGSLSCRMTHVQKLDPTCRSVGSAGWSAARRARSRHIPPSSVASIISDGKILFLCCNCWTWLHLQLQPSSLQVSFLKILGSWNPT